jgi:hypothetical protein
MFPFIPAPTITAFSVTAPVEALRDATTGCGGPVAQAVM